MVYPGFENIRGWCPASKAERLEQLASAATLCVEIGVFGGQSFFALGYGSRTCLLVAVDPWRSAEAFQKLNPGFELAFDWEQVYQDFLADVENFGLAPRTTVLRMTSQEALPRIEGPIDLLHIDGNHDTEKVMWDVANWVPKVRPGGVIILDDVDWDTVKPAFELLKELTASCVNHGTWCEAKTRKDES